jgi:translation initiation factor 6
MSIEQAKLLGSSFVGVYAAASDKAVLVPRNAGSKFSRLAEEALGVRIVEASVYNSGILGVMVAMNSSGIVVPKLAFTDEIRELEKLGSVGVIDDFTAIGNLVSANDKGAVASPLLSKAAVKTVEETLGVPVRQFRVAGFEVTGSCVVATNKGFLANPNTPAAEIEMLEEALGVGGTVGSLNYGSQLVKGSVVANSNGAVVGDASTPFELGRLDEALFFGKEAK